MGWSYRSGTAFNRYVRWNDINDYYKYDTGPNVTMAVMMRFVGAVPAAARTIFSKRFDITSLSGISIDLTAAGLFRFMWANGAVQQTLDSTSGASSLFTRLIVCRRTNAQADIWIDGVMENSVAGPILAVNEPARSVKLFGDNTSVVLNAQAGFAGLWERALTNQEIALLHVDPWVMWKPAAGLGALGAAGLGMDGCKCGGPWLHAWSGLG
jgi:hypothetical protein